MLQLQKGKRELRTKKNKWENTSRDRGYLNLFENDPKDGDGGLISTTLKMFFFVCTDIYMRQCSFRSYQTPLLIVAVRMSLKNTIKIGKTIICLWLSRGALERDTTQSEKIVFEKAFVFRIRYNSWGIR